MRLLLFCGLFFRSDRLRLSTAGIVVLSSLVSEKAMKITDIEAIHLRAEDPLIELFDG